MNDLLQQAEEKLKIANVRYISSCSYMDGALADLKLLIRLEKDKMEEDS